MFSDIALWIPGLTMVVQSWSSLEPEFLSGFAILCWTNNALRWAEKMHLALNIKISDLLYFNSFEITWKLWLANHFYPAHRKISLSSWSKQIRQIMVD